MIQPVWKYLVVVGVMLILAGFVLFFLEGKTGWFGKLPGDIRIERENFRFYFPVTTMILVSVALSLLVYLIRRIW